MLLGIPDEEFIRGQIPMTKQELRILAVAKLQLQETSIVYDVGAGTGSVTVEMARQCSRGMVYAIEQRPEGISLICQNRDRFQLSNVEPICGTAPEVLTSLPTPTHVFLGGTGGKLPEIVTAIREKNPNVRFVATAVTVETLTLLNKLPQQYPEYRDMELIQVGIARGLQRGNYHLLQAENPVYMAVFGGERRVWETTRKEECNEQNA
jgi:precorrin-6Y C5,15-methyltransferase (decarboxylating)